MPDLMDGKRSGKTFFERALIIVMAVICVILLCRVFFAAAYLKVYVVGSSMADTLTGAVSEDVSGGDYVYAIKNAQPKRGDIVIIETQYTSEGRNIRIIKRLIAFGGESVELKNGVLYINDVQYDEPYITPERNTISDKITYQRTVVPEGKLFCMGDNRNSSTDSRDKKYGFIDNSAVVGVVAEWSMELKGVVTFVNTLFEFGK